MTEPLSLQLLGGVSLRQGNTPITGFVSNKVLAVFVYLAVTRRVHTRHHLANLFWGNLPDADAGSNLRLALWNLRQVVEPYLDISRTTVAFRLNSPNILDVAEFEQRMDHVQELPAPLPGADAIARLEPALRLYQGDFLEGFHVRDAEEFETWALVQRERLRHMAIYGLTRLIVLEQERADFPQAIEYAQRLLAMEPWQEEAHRQLMELYALSGNKSAAFAQYESCRRVLDQELGSAPGVETIGLYERILRGEIAPPNESKQPLDAAPRHNLPVAPTPFFGRQEEIERIKNKILEPSFRLVTLVGEGGVGKTRLSLAVGEGMVPDFAHGVWFVPLAGVEAAPQEAAQALQRAIVQALRLPLDVRRDVESQLMEYLRSRELLLVLDNLEHLTEGAAWIAEMMAQAPHLRVLATSRARLRLQLEFAFRIEGLPIPPDARAQDAAGYSSIQLFFDRANRIGAEVDWETEHLEIIQICQLVGGSPLAIELAATQLLYTTPIEIVRALQAGEDSLSTTMRDVPVRHRSMRAVFEYSWQQLTPDEQAIFQKISVFRGGMTREAAAAVTGRRDSAVILAALSDKSLVRSIGRGRYQVHELLRQYGSEKLEQSQGASEIRERHSTYYCGLLYESVAPLKGSQQGETLQALRRERDNLVAGWHWAVTNAASALLREALEGFYLFYELQGQVGEGTALLDDALKSQLGERLAPDVIVRLLTRQAHFYLRMGYTERAQALLRTSAALAETLPDPDDMAMLWFDLGALHLDRNEIPRARQFLRLALDEYQRGADNWGAARTMIYLSFVAMRVNELPEAREWANAALVCQRASGDAWGLGNALHTLGTVEGTVGNYEIASETYRECLALRRQIGDLFGAATTLNNLGDVLYRRGEYTEAQSWYRQAQALAVQLNQPEMIISTLQGLGTIALRLGDYEQAINTRLEYVHLLPEMNDRFLLDCDLMFQAQLAHAQGQSQYALDLIAPFLQHPKTDPWLRNEAADLERTILAGHSA